jgi:hypothetical protein
MSMVYELWMAPHGERTLLEPYSPEWRRTAPTRSRSERLSRWSRRAAASLGAHAGISRQSITKRFNGQSSKLARRSLASGWSMEVASAHGGAEKISCEVREHQGVRGEFISGLEILAASAARCSQRFVFVDHGSSWGRT